MDTPVQCLPEGMDPITWSGWNFLELLKERVEQISIPLARVFNFSLKREWFLLNGKRQTSYHYLKRVRERVSLTSVICKLLERLTKYHMVNFLFRHKLLNPSQHGFLREVMFNKYVMFLEEITK